MPDTLYGYISLEGNDEAEIERLHDQLTTYAVAEGWTLAKVFVDRNTPTARIVRPGLTVLLDALRSSDRGGVLVPGPQHLSASLPVRQAIEAEIAETGARVLTFNGRTDHGRPEATTESHSPY